jgi:predicted dehydrogenase
MKVNKKTIGIIGSGSHFSKRIYPILLKSSFFKIGGILKKNKINFKNIKYFNEKDFFEKEFDFVYISCPNLYHEKFIIKSLKVGSHVICEKPFVVRKKNINKIIKLSLEKKKLIFETFMYMYHPAFQYIKDVIENKKYGKLHYVISNFRYPSLQKNNNRYKKTEGDGFFYDSASYLISLENFLFNKISGKNIKFLCQKIKKNVDLKGNIFISSPQGNRFYFWGEGQNYSNNLEIFFEKGVLHIDKFFSKRKYDKIVVKIFSNKKKEKNIKKTDQFKEMFKTIEKNYLNRSFQKFHALKIKTQLNLMVKYKI